MLVTSPALSSRKHYIRDNQDIISDISSIAHNFKLYVSNHMFTCGYQLTIDLRIETQRVIQQLEAIRQGASSYIERIVNKINHCFSKPKPADPKACQENARFKVLSQLRLEFQKAFFEFREYRDVYATKLDKGDVGSSEDASYLEKYLANTPDDTAERLIDFYEDRLENRVANCDVLMAWMEFVTVKFPGVQDILPGIREQIIKHREIISLRENSGYEDNWLPGIPRRGEKVPTGTEVNVAHGLRSFWHYPKSYKPVTPGFEPQYAK